MKHGSYSGHTELFFKTILYVPKCPHHEEYAGTVKIYGCLTGRAGGLQRGVINVKRFMKKYRFSRNVTLVFCIAFTGYFSFGGCSSEDFETKQTQRLMGIVISAFPHKDVKPLILKSKDMVSINFTISEQKFEGSQIPYSFNKRKTVTATSKDKEVFVAYCGWLSDSIVMPRRGVKSDLANRRHCYNDYFGMKFHPFDVVVGRLIDGKVDPKLFFFDVGSLSTSPHALAIDENGKAHLVVSDIFVENNATLKVYWAIGNLSKEKWEKLFIVEEQTEVNYSAPRGASTKDTVHFVLNNWYKDKNGGSFRLIHYSKKQTGEFEKPIIIYSGNEIDFDVAGCRTSDKLLVVYSSERGVFLLCNQNGTWKSAQLLPDELTNKNRVSVECVRIDCYKIRISGKKDRQFEIKLS